MAATNYTYNEMNHGRTEYEGFYGLADRIRFYGLHCHDFYEFYIHFQGARYYGIDNEVFLLQPNQLLIIPPIVFLIRDRLKPCFFKKQADMQRILCISACFIFLRYRSGRWKALLRSASEDPTV